ncbi:MAG: right-handed parallel beta-helix repeat-containing protein [Pseudomonadota bacterium]
MQPRRRRTIRHLSLLALLAILAAGAAAWYLQSAGVAPRALARDIERRAEGAQPLVADSAGWVARSLTRLDRGDSMAPAVPGIGALPGAVAANQAGREVLLGSAAEVRSAIDQARPGDVLTVLPGRYRFDQPLSLARPGRPDAKITLRARLADTVFIEFGSAQGFAVTAPDWRVENLTIGGACARQPDCEHGFHVVGAAQRFASLNNTVTDFNAHFKINGEQGRFPDDGLIEGNTLTNGSARQTDSAVTVIDMVGANGWTFRRNLISDFVKVGGDRISYGAFAKGGGARNVFEQNVVVCESRLRGLPGQRVGLSLGGGGSGKQYCRGGKCIPEQDEGVIRSNLVASCSDAGIYLNSAARSAVLHNTLLDTAGIEARFAGTSADVEGNLVDGQIVERQGALLRRRENRDTGAAALFAGQHPVRQLFAGDGAAMLAWRAAPPRRTAFTPALPDLCATTRPPLAALGAFEDMTRCQNKPALR